MPILVEDSTKTVPSAYGEAFDLVRSEGLGLGSQRCRCSKRPMSAVQVGVLLVLAQRVPEVCLVPDQRAVQQLAAQRLDPALHDRVGPSRRMHPMPLMRDVLCA